MVRMVCREDSCTLYRSMTKLIVDDSQVVGTWDKGSVLHWILANTLVILCIHKVIL